jgi:hypothetical protein
MFTCGEEKRPSGNAEDLELKKVGESGNVEI